MFQPTIEHIVKMWKQAGFNSKLVGAPKDAQTFDQMLIVFADPACRVIRKVYLCSSQTGLVVTEY